MIYPDANLENADWAKATWDLDTPAFIAWVKDATKREVVKFTKLPAYQAAPMRVQKAVVARLLR